MTGVGAILTRVVDGERMMRQYVAWLYRAEDVFRSVSQVGFQGLGEAQD